MRRMWRWVLGWGCLAAASAACSSGLANAPSREEPLPVFGAPEEVGDGPLLLGEPLLEVAAPAVPSRCTPRGWLYLSRVAQSVLPTRQRPRRPVVEVLPGGSEPPELAAPFGERRVIEVADGALVALDQGEFGGGLYHLPRGALHAEALDSHLSYRIHWIGQASDRFYGVSGLCHGIGCAAHQRSVVFELRLEPVSAGDDAREQWHIDPIAVLPGCPDEVAIDHAERAVLVATCHGLFRVDHVTATTLATWPTWLAAIDIAEVRGVESSTFFVSFGALIGRFRAGQASWFSAPECAHR